MGQRLDEFSAAAAECVEAARRTSDPVAAATFLLMAEKWIRLADEKAHTDDRLQDQLSDFNPRQMFDNAGP
jgi:hypothetical protein